MPELLYADLYAVSLCRLNKAYTVKRTSRQRTASFRQSIYVQRLLTQHLLCWCHAAFCDCLIRGESTARVLCLVVMLMTLFACPISAAQYLLAYSTM